MWLISDDLLFSVPDDAPTPPRAKRVELPEGFHDDPGRWQVQNGAIVEVKRKKRAESAGLTAADIKAIKAAIAAGKL
ncbi:hypothetical protein [Flavisphingomonas formosensis]|uniref:hypothetical protein n=1 Tax=Flavisphingomonas formosensis TaxID=861534 RepID=UPI0012F99C24|nr:hypothetical protein [Sphingomonas formosensis]